MALFGLPAQPVYAHANLLRAVPEPNSVLQQPLARITLWFSERIAPGFSGIQVLDTQGRQVDDNDSTVTQDEETVLTVTLRRVPHGLYTVVWKNVSMVDGHRLRGSFVFAVGEPIRRSQETPPAQPWLQSPAAPVLRWLALLSALTVVGGMGFMLLVSQALLTKRVTSDPVRRVGAQVTAHTVQRVWIAMGVLGVASIGQLLDHTAVAADVPLYQTFGRPLATVLTSTDWGYLWLGRAGILGLIATVLCLSRASQQPADAGRGAWFHCVLWATVLGNALLLTFSLISHGAATLEIRAAAVCADYLHVLAVGFWGGGLLHLALSLSQEIWREPAAVRRAVLTALVPRFSLLASLCVCTVIITGAYNTWAQVTVLPALRTPYGVTLFVKLVLVLPLLGLGALQLLWVRPRLASEGTAGAWLRRGVTAEALLVVLILGTVGLLTSLEPARQVAVQQGSTSARPLTFQDTVEGVRITLTITPGRVGSNRVVVALTDRRGTPVRHASQVALRLSALEADLGALEALAAAQSDGTYVLDDALLSLAGPWQLQIVIRRQDAFDARTVFRFAVTPLGAGVHAAITPTHHTGTLLWGSALLLLGGLFVAIGLPLHRRGIPTGRLVMGSGVVCSVVAMAFLGTLQSAGMRPRSLASNPFPPTVASVQEGQRLYAERCASCHGPSGRGNGPLAAGLRPPPADLVMHAPLHADRDLFQTIRDGIAGTAMVPFGGHMPEEEIWHTINYLKTLGQ
jgi:copper transport protein